MILKIREGVEPFDFNTGPEILHFDKKGVTVSDILGQKLLNILPLEQIAEESVEEFVDAASERLDVPEITEAPVEVKKTRKTNKK